MLRQQKFIEYLLCARYRARCLGRLVSKETCPLFPEDLAVLCTRHVAASSPRAPRVATVTVSLASPQPNPDQLSYLEAERRMTNKNPRRGSWVVFRGVGSRDQSRGRALGQSPSTHHPQKRPHGTGPCPRGKRRSLPAISTGLEASSGWEDARLPALFAGRAIPSHRLLERVRS